jgi:CBS domain-containing protein
MKIGEMCTRPAITLGVSATLSEAAVEMRTQAIGMVVVTTGQNDAATVIGVLTDRDILRAQLAHTADLNRLSVGEAMTRRPLVLSEDESVDGAVYRLRDRGVRRAPVVATDGTLSGVLSTDDLLEQLIANLNGVAGIVAARTVKV